MLSAALSIAALFAIGLLIAAVMPTAQGAQVLGGIRRSPLFGKPRPSEPEQIAVTAGVMNQAQVTIISRSGHTDLRVTPGGVLGICS